MSPSRCKSSRADRLSIEALPSATASPGEEGRPQKGGASQDARCGQDPKGAGAKTLRRVDARNYGVEAALVMMSLHSGCFLYSAP